MSDFDDLTRDQPRVADWPQLVRRTIQLRQRRRRAATAAAVMTVVLLGGAAAVRASGPAPTQRLTVAQDPTPMGAASPDVTQLPTAPPPSVTPAPTVPASTPGPSTSVPPKTTTTADPTPSPTPTPTPTPLTRTQTLQIVRVTSAPTSAEVGQRLRYSAVVRWSAEEPSLITSCADCHDVQPPTPCRAGSYHDPQPGEQELSTARTFTSAGDFRVQLIASAGCGHYWVGHTDGPTFVVHVTDPATPTPTNSPTPASPSPSP